MVEDETNENIGVRLEANGEFIGPDDYIEGEPVYRLDDGTTMSIQVTYEEYADLVIG